MNDRELLARIELRNGHAVYRLADGAFLVEQIDRHGAIHGQRLPARVVDWLGAQLAGALVRVERAAELLEMHADELDLPYTYGHKLRYFAQDALLVLIATGRAVSEREGHGFVYLIGRLDS